MSARRYVGKARLYIEAQDRTTDDGRWIYQVRIVVPRRVRHCLDQEFVYQATVHDSLVMSGVGGVRWEESDHPQKLVALDSPEAFDAIARSAVNLNSVFLAEQPDPDEKTADAINEATQEGLDEDGAYIVRRIR